jgi:hypothetical protein
MPGRSSSRLAPVPEAPVSEEGRPHASPPRYSQHQNHPTVIQRNGRIPFSAPPLNQTVGFQPSVKGPSQVNRVSHAVASRLSHSVQAGPLDQQDINIPPESQEISYILNREDNIKYDPNFIAKNITGIKNHSALNVPNNPNPPLVAYVRNLLRKPITQHLNENEKRLLNSLLTNVTDRRQKNEDDMEPLDYVLIRLIYNYNNERAKEIYNLLTGTQHTVSVYFNNKKDRETYMNEKVQPFIVSNPEKYSWMRILTNGGQKKKTTTTKTTKKMSTR